MKFKPLMSDYNFDDSLHTDIPEYLQEPLSGWLLSVLARIQVVHKTRVAGYTVLDSEFKNRLNIALRESFHTDLEEFLSHVFSSHARAITVIQFVLFHHSNGEEAAKLESILKTGGSAYKMHETEIEAGRLAFDLTKRVPEIVEKVAKEALNQEDKLREAWGLCYGLSPDYSKTVIRCQDVIEGLLKDNYFPKDPKPQLGKLLANIQDGNKKLDFKGNDILDDPNILLGLIKDIAKYRDVHTTGTGKPATSKQAEYILHTTIYIWNLHQK